MVDCPKTLEQLRDAMVSGEIWDGAPMKFGELDWTSLPTFGGDEPRNTFGIWSWDATRVLVGEDARYLRIVDRDDK